MVITTIDTTTLAGIILAIQGGTTILHDGIGIGILIVGAIDA